MSGPVTLLHDGDLLDDLLQIRLHRNLLDSHHLARLLVNGFKNTAIGTRHTNNLTSPSTTQIESCYLCNKQEER